jgi:hypothetical protein
MSYRITLDYQDHGSVTSAEAWGTEEEAQRELARVLTGDGASIARYLVLPALDPMAQPPAPGEFRGSGQVHCCGHHKERCHFGRQHTWSTWFAVGRLQRTGSTFHCYDCGGVCIGEEDAAAVTAGGGQR